MQFLDDCLLIRAICVGVIIYLISQRFVINSAVNVSICLN